MRRALAFLCLLALPACESQPRESEDVMFRASDDTGSLRVALVASDANGKSYRLRKATFELSGNAMLTLNCRDQEALQTPLPEGNYQMFLRPGYELVERTADGEEHVISAQLKSPNPMLLHVSSRVDGNVALAFRGERGDIAFGESRGLRAGAAEPATVLAASTAP